MSRHNFFPKDDYSNYNVVVGWDRGLSSFFFQYGDVCSDLPLNLSTGQRYAEHQEPDVVVALAIHFASSVPADLVDRLLADRENEGSYSDISAPLNVTFSTQADNGDEVNTEVSRDSLKDMSGVAAVAEWVLHQFDVDEIEAWDQENGPPQGNA
ncbi:hypothetical protein [Sphingomonas sp. VNH70]|uniref:hypothetical protein n=1 Tax=Sphingomonas silueang TaxID=3156617 RepID=UPI0032B3A5B0